MISKYFILVKNSEKDFILVKNSNEKNSNEKNFKLKENSLIEWCEQLCSPDKVFLDIGAHTGEFTISLADKCKKVYAFEYEQMIYYALCGGVALSNLDNVTCLNFKLGSEEQFATNSTIDNILCSTPDISNIGFIRINNVDCLLNILKGSLETLKQSNYPKILFKVDKNNIDNINSLLSNLEYKFIKINNCEDIYLAEKGADIKPLSIENTDIPIIIVCYNNWKYVLNTINQIKHINPIYYNNIQIMDNCST